MKQRICLLIAVLFSFGIFTLGFAQSSSGDFSVEVGLGFGTEIESIAIQGGGIYGINERIRAAADFIYHLPGEDTRGVDFNWIEFNANGHFLIVNSENVSTYLLGGLNLAKLFSDSPDIELPSGDSTDKIYMGLNVGAGTEIPIGSINAYIEGKYALSSAHQLVLTGGLRIPINI